MSALDDIARIVRAVTGDYRYERSYQATVERVNSDDTVDVLPDDASVRGVGLQRVPVALTDPTTTARPEAGCRCLLSFLEGDPRRPCITAWEYAQNSATVQLDDGAAGIARKGDLIDVELSASTPVAGILNGSYTIPGSPPTVVQVVNGQLTGTATIATPVRAVIIGGAASVKA